MDKPTAASKPTRTDNHAIPEEVWSGVTRGGSPFRRNANGKLRFFVRTPAQPGTSSANPAKEA